MKHEYFISMAFKNFSYICRICIFVGFVGLLLPSHAEAVDCTVPISGNISISSSCSFPGTVNGADAGTGTTNTASVTVSTGATLTIGATQTIAVGSLVPSGGSIAIITGGQVKIGSPLWMTDADADGYPSATTQVIQATAPTNGRRRNLLTSLTQADTNDASACATNGASAGTCQTCLNGAPSNAGAGADPNSDCTASYNACSGNNRIGPDGNCNGSGACNTTGLSSACATAGTCQTGGGCSGGSCTAVSNVASGQDPNNQCTASYNACSGNNRIGPDGNCNGSAACNTGGLSSACATAGTCQTGGGCSGGSCVGIGNTANGSTGINCTAAHYRCNGSGSCTAPTYTTCAWAGGLSNCGEYCGTIGAISCVGSREYSDCSWAQFACNDNPRRFCECLMYSY